MPCTQHFSGLATQLSLGPSCSSEFQGNRRSWLCFCLEMKFKEVLVCRAFANENTVIRENVSSLLVR